MVKSLSKGLFLYCKISFAEHCFNSTLFRRQENKDEDKLVISRDPWQRYTPPQPHTKKCFIRLRSRASLSISALSGRRGLYAHAYGIYAPFYCISLKYIQGVH